MGSICSKVENNRRDNSQRIIKISKFAKRIVNYYLLHRKIQDIMNMEKRQFDNYQINSINRVKKSEKLYIINDIWIQNWLISCKYNIFKNQFDKDYSENIPDIVKMLQRISQETINSHNIKEFDRPFFNNEKAFTNFISSNKLSINSFNNIIDEETYKSLLHLNFSNYSKEPKYIKGIISNKMIILFISEYQIVKFLYQGFVENRGEELIQLTVNCLELDRQTNKFDLDISKFKYQRFKDFILKKEDEQIISLFDSFNINYLEEVTFKMDKFLMTIKNENLICKNQNEVVEVEKKINFQNIDKIRLIGLDNVGATCYMNATLQCFLNINSLTKYLLNEQIYQKINNDFNSSSLSKAYCNLLEKVWLDDNITTHYAPKRFKRVISARNPLFEGINANDSKDLINFMLEEMNSELSKLNISNEINNNIIFPMIEQNNMQQIFDNFRNDFSRKNNSIIAQQFFFILQTNTKCLSCNNLKFNFQALFLLEFPLELIFNYNISQNIPSINNKGKKSIDLYSCFNHYSIPTDFVGENQLYCNYCQGLRNAKSSNTLFSLPPVFVIILNRGKGKSFDCDVNFPQYLNLQNYVGHPQSICNYQLIGVISHLGESGMSGHFIVYCRHRIDKRWYLYNDSTVTLCKDQNNEFMVGTAYILFYESVDNKNNMIFEQNINLNLMSNNININKNNLNNNFNNNFSISNNMCMNNMNIIQNNILNTQGLNSVNNITNSINMNGIGMNINNMNCNVNNFKIGNMNQMNNNMNPNINQMNNNMNTNMNQINNSINPNINQMNNSINPNMNQINNNMNPNMNQMNNNMNPNMNQMNNNMNTNINQMNNNMNTNMNQINNSINPNINQMNNNMNTNMNQMNNDMNTNINQINNSINPNMNQINNNVNTNMNQMDNNMNPNMNQMNNNMNTNINQMNNNMNTNINQMNNNMNQMNNNMNPNMNPNMNQINNNMNSNMNQINNNMNPNMNQINNSINQNMNPMNNNNMDPNVNQTNNNMNLNMIQNMNLMINNMNQNMNQMNNNMNQINNSMNLNLNQMNNNMNMNMNQMNINNNNLNNNIFNILNINYYYFYNKSF